MIIRYSEISRIRFPVFVLPSSDWFSQDGLLFVDNQILDDKNMPGTSLGARRVQTFHSNLLPLNKSIDTHLGIIKQPTLQTYVDMDGKPFIYEKSKMCKLKYYKIKDIEKRTTASVLRFRGVKRPFEVPRPPKPGYFWAGILHLHDTPWMLYEYSREELPERRRKV